MSTRKLPNKNWIWKASLSLFFAVLMYTTTALAGTITLSWDAPKTNTDSTLLKDLKGFIIYYGTAPGKYTTRLDVGNVTTYNFVNLNDVGTYYFTVTAYNTARNESSFSNEVSKTIGPTPVGYKPQWLIATMTILMLAGGYGLSRRQRA
jgi:hypothetical protein